MVDCHCEWKLNLHPGNVLLFTRCSRSSDCRLDMAQFLPLRNSLALIRYLPDADSSVETAGYQCSGLRNVCQCIDGAGMPDKLIHFSVGGKIPQADYVVRSTGRQQFFTVKNNGPDFSGDTRAMPSRLCRKPDRRA